MQDFNTISPKWILDQSRMSNIESNDSQNGALEDYNIILMETFHILVPPL
jgi:hypothetical protein